MTTKETKHLPLTPKKIWIIVLLICYAFILSGGVNTGFSKFFMAFPFMLIAIRVATKVLKTNYIKYTTYSLILFSIIFNITITKNPMVFPILYEGYIEVVSDGFHVTYSDGSGGFTNFKEKVNYGKTIYKELKKGEKYKVTGINISHPDFSTKIYLQTAIGQFSQSDYQNTHSITPNKNVYTTSVKFLSFLMNWPIFFMLYPPLGFLVFAVILVFLWLIFSRLPKS